MDTGQNKIQVIKDVSLQSKDTITIHLDYNESLTLKEFSYALDLINKAINDVNRKNGLKDNAKLGREYAAEVKGVDSGSIVIHILTNFVAPVALSMLATFLYDRLKSVVVKKDKSQAQEKSDYPICIYVNGNNNRIDVNITKSNNSISDALENSGL